MMPRKARKRPPDEPVLATFMISHEKWQDFQKAAKAKGTTASATIVAFIDGYLGGDQSFEIEETEPELETQSEAENSGNLDAVIEKVVGSKIARFDEMLNHLDQSFRELDERIEKVTSIEKVVGSKFASFEQMLNHLHISVQHIDERLEKVENAARQVKSEMYNAPKLIDIEAVTLDSSNIDINTDQSSDEQLNNLTGLTEKALCEEFGLNPSSIVRNAKMRGLSSPDYLNQITGWVYVKGKYYPPEQ